MKLINLYLDEIQQHLPHKNREDILKEIRSTLMDMIEDRSPNAGQMPDEETIKAVLQEFGSPRKVAQQYSEHHYLIGPRIFPVYLKVLKIVLIIVAGLNVLGLIVAIVSQSGVDYSMIDAIASVFSGLFSSLFTAFGIVTLSFAGIERTSPEEWKFKIEESWRPEDLLKQEDRKQIKVTELAIEVTLTLVFITLINFYLDRIGIYYLGDSGWVSAPLLNENFLRYVPWITAYAVLDIALNLYLFRQNYWDSLATIGKVLINALKIAVSFVILTGPDVITVSQSAWQTLNFDVTMTAQEITRMMNIGLDVLLGLAIFGLVVESIKRLYEGFIKGNHTRIDFETN